ncbi:MAG: catalase [Planctomycetes bacterium]|nr:catalase [Planctomycetota bacterium]
MPVAPDPSLPPGQPERRHRPTTSAASRPAADKNAKTRQLDGVTTSPHDQILTTDQGVRVDSTDDSLLAGERGPTLLEDFHLREKIMRFDHERIPERVVHARGAGAHGHFQLYEPLPHLTRAAFLCDTAVRTPVFVRFSTVVGSRGSADTVRDVRGFAVKFYTSEGNYDLVGNNMPVFFIQDGIKFPDLVHALKPQPNNEIPQAQSAHDSFWDFVSLTPETAHMVMWVMSDRAIPRSFRMMEGFGVHTFRLVTQEGKAHLVKFHWKPLLGVHSLAWEEAQQIAGKDPDFHRRDLWEAIANGAFPEYELGIQVVDEADALTHGFDLLDATKLVPEELVPVQRIGKLTLDRNPTNFFAEVEQVAFCVGNVVPGIDFTNDPLLQARLFSYLDTQITRLGGPNFAELPINRPVAPVHNNQHDGFARQTINAGVANYLPNSLGNGSPRPAKPSEGGYHHFRERVDGRVVRARSATFTDHFSQARMFLASLSPVERAHLSDALCFEIGKVDRLAVRERVVRDLLSMIDGDLAATVARAVGITVVAPNATEHESARGPASSPALSMANTVLDSIATRRIAVLVAPGVITRSIAQVKAGLEKDGAVVEFVSLHQGPITGDDGEDLDALRSLLNTPSVIYDAVVVADGDESVTILAQNPDAHRFVQEAFRHHKAIAALGRGQALLSAVGIQESAAHPGVVTAGNPDLLLRGFRAAVAKHRHWERITDKPLTSARPA